MLIKLEQFLIRYGVRSAIYLPSPTITKQRNLDMPREAVVHHLDMKSDIMFPNRHDYYLDPVDENKKVRIMQVDDLTVKEGTIKLRNRYLPRDIRNWKNSHRKTFREQDLIKEPNNDQFNIGVINYNPVKDLYDYKTNIFHYYNYNNNILNTLNEYLGKALKADHSTQILPLDLPNNIPGFNALRRMMKYEGVKLATVLRDPGHFFIFELFKWLGFEDLVDNDQEVDADDNESDLNEKGTRGKSIFKDITDEDSKRIILELKYRGYSCFIPLSVIRALSKESRLESSKKLGDVQMKKFFCSFLVRIQDTITEMTAVDVSNSTELKSDLDPLDAETDDEYDDVIEDSVIEDATEGESVDDIPDYERGKLSRRGRDKGIVKGLRKRIKDDTDDNADFKGTTDSDTVLLDTAKYDDNDSDMFDYDKVKDRKAKTRSISKVGKITLSPIDKDSPLDIAEEETDVDIEEVSGPLSEEEERKLLDDQTFEETVEEFIEEGKRYGTLTAAEIRSVRTTQEKRKRLISPYNLEPIDQFTTASVGDVKLKNDTIDITIDNELVDDSLKTDKIRAFDTEYVNNYLDKDIVSSMMGFERAGLFVTDYSVETVRSIADNYEIHKVSVKPIKGKPSTLFFRIPKVDENGTYMVGGVKYRMRKLRQDLPIRKISPIRVALTSNYGKFFISRTERKASDPASYLVEFIRKNYLDGATIVKKIIPGRKRLNLIQGLPNDYYALAREFDRIETVEHTFIFTDKEAASILKAEVLDDIKSIGSIFIGHNKAQDILVIDQDNIVTNYSTKEDLGTIPEILGIDPKRLPKSYSVMKVLGTDISLGVCMAYYMGISNLIRLMKVDYRVVAINDRPKLEKDEFEIRFFDERLILKLETEEARLLFHGFRYYQDFLKLHPLRSFDTREIYLPLVELRGASLYHLKELECLQKIFIDPITEDVLKMIKEPTAFLPLILRANELLTDYSHPDIGDPLFTRIRGYDRIPGLMYRAISESVRQHHIRGRGNQKISLDPYKVWNYITQDSSGKTRDVLNPMLTCKEDEVVTLSGRDGLSSMAMPDELRRYHMNDAGLISEATVDSKNVSVVTYMTPYAKLENVRGLVEPNFDEMKENPAKIFSTPNQLAPMTEYDDAKRLAYTNGQMSHTIPSPSYRQPALRTGYEYVMPFKDSGLFCKMANDDGVVISVSKKLLKVRYQDGTEEVYSVTPRYGTMEGVEYKHVLLTNLKEGDKLKKGDTLYYHKDFYEPDWLDPRKLLFKYNRLVTVALAVNAETYEDSSAISRPLMESMTTNVLHERAFTLKFNTNLTNLVGIGDEVTSNTPLFVNLGEVGDVGNLSDSSIALLEGLTASSPRAKFKGVIDKMEVRYNGDKADMSPSLGKLVSKLDREVYESTKGTHDEVKTNRVTGEYTSKGAKLDLDTLELKISISVDLDMGIGDKVVVGNQAKSVIGEVFNYTMTGEKSGTVVDMQFGLLGFLHRMIDSPFRMGTANRVLDLTGVQVADVYFKALGDN